MTVNEWFPHNNNYGNESAFASLDFDGNVITWGDNNSGGNFNYPYNNELSDISFIASNSSSFAAVNNDGRVFTWGNISNGGSMSIIPNTINGFGNYLNLFDNCGNTIYKFNINDDHKISTSFDTNINFIILTLPYSSGDITQIYCGHGPATNLKYE